MIAEPDPDPSGARADAEPRSRRPWRIIAGGSAGAAPEPVPVESALRLLVEQFEQGLAVTDRSGRAHFLNRAARAFVDRGLLRLVHGCLRGSSPADGAALRRILSGCAAGRGVSARLEGEGGTLLVAACAIPPAPGPAAGGAVLLRLVDPAQARLPGPGALQDQFGFTPAEAALAVDILAGNDLAASALRRGVTRNTVRVHLRRLFEKTGTRRQAELMRLLLLSPQPIATAQGGYAKNFPRGTISRPNEGCGRSTIQRR
ncbi:helix-turn-helix transcriptional regulator [Methylobacterium sp. J-070]|uniref:helix-turn-helix transcriptional regulator n=1 Tax=Methylobacterium sp. J-070 TaxID=2836650 RepID=UPI001FBBFA7F|nr:helix-turn-helix transcriptional regulator [Methylobacterium sp. J-070]MCJ2048287.1 helix-turn-helix transcriptional regulator [Methylobacterium sp. J-070]